MRKVLFLLGLFFTGLTFGQSPETIKYQAVVRNDAGDAVKNQPVSFIFGIIQGTPGGSAVYTETQNDTTNSFGLVSINIGEGTSGDDFSAIDWSNGPYFLKVEMDETGGSSYTEMGTSQILSTPYALYAKTAGCFPGDQVDDADADSTNELLTNALLVNDTLKLTDAGGIKNVDLSSLINLPSSGIVLSKTNPNTALEAAGFTLIGRMKAEIGDTSGTANYVWEATSMVNAPSERAYHTAIWTGTEMIVWGGSNSSGYLKDGARYNPETNKWTAMDTTNAPSARNRHTAVWTGTEMIVWGGYDGGVLQTGAVYNPTTNTWTSMNIIGAPAGRRFHTAVWADSVMLVFGGFDGASNELNNGGKYNPVSNAWSAISSASDPNPVYNHTAVWTGTEMYIGCGFNDMPMGTVYSKSYNLAGDSWSLLNTINHPVERSNHTAVWTGSDMILWGGRDFSSNPLNSGAKCTSGAWLNLPTSIIPERELHTAVWTGSKMIIWGGTGSSYFNDGAIYDDATNTWDGNTSMVSAPEERASHTAVWTGDKMIVWGGKNSDYLGTGGILENVNYSPANPGFLYLYMKQ